MAQNLLVNLRATSAASAPASWGTVTGLSASGITVQGTDSVLILIATIKIANAADEWGVMRFNINGNTSISPVLQMATDAATADESAGTTLVFAVDGLSGSSNSFSVEWQIGALTPIADTARDRSFQVIEITGGNAEILYQDSQTNQVLQTTQNPLFESSSVSIASTESVVMLLSNVAPGITGTTDANANMRFEVDGTPEGAITCMAVDDSDILYGWSGIHCLDGISGSHTFGLGWTNRLGAARTHASWQRTFQVVEFRNGSAVLQADINLTSSQTSPTSYNTMTGMTHTYTPDSSDSISLLIANAQMIGTVTTDSSAVFSFAQGGTLIGAETSAFYDTTNLVQGVCLGWAVTGVSASTTWDLRWDSTQGTSQPTLDTARNRTFFLIEFLEGLSIPVITNIGDEDFTIGETNIVITGTDFLSPQGIGKVELGDSATYASATKVTQSIDSWADTSIQFDLTLGALDQEQLWLYVTNSDDNVSNAWEVHVEMTPTITNAGDEEFEPTETNIVMTGTNFLATQSTGKVELVNNSVYASGTKVEQTSIDSWADGSIQFDLSIGSFTEVDLWLFATNSLGHVSTGYAVEILRTPTITDVEDESLAANEKGVEIDGTYFLDTKGTGKVELSNNSSYGSGTLVTQVTNGWDTDLITFNVTMGTLSLGTNYLFVTNDQGKVSTSYTVTIVEAIPEALYQTSSIQASITSAGLDTVIFLIRDE